MVRIFAPVESADDVKNELNSVFLPKVSFVIFDNRVKVLDMFWNNTQKSENEFKNRTDEL